MVSDGKAVLEYHGQLLPVEWIDASPTVSTRLWIDRIDDSIGGEVTVFTCDDLKYYFRNPGRPKAPQMIHVEALKAKYKARMDEYHSLQDEATANGQDCSAPKPASLPLRPAAPLLTSTSRLTSITFLLILAHTVLGIISMYHTVKDVDMLTPDVVGIWVFGLASTFVENTVVNM
jgi:hypothetical protein